MRPDSSLLSIGLSPSILGGLEGPFDFMKVYPYECWEQKISRAVMAGAAADLAPYFSNSFSWQNAPGEADADTCHRLRVSGPERRNGLLRAPR